MRISCVSAIEVVTGFSKQTSLWYGIRVFCSEEKRTKYCIKVLLKKNRVCLNFI